jgi:hypothetical protein
MSIGFDIQDGFPGGISMGFFMQKMKPFIEQALQDAKGEIRSRIPIGASGFAQRSVGYRLDDKPEEGFDRLIYIPPGLPAAKYAYYIENKRLPGAMPPWQVGSSLYAWVKRKITSEKSKKKGGKQIGKSKSLDREILSASFLIARHIAEYGTYDKKDAPQPFKRGWEIASPRVKRILEYGIEQTLKEIGN